MTKQPPAKFAGARVRRVRAGSGHSYQTTDGRRLLGVTTALKPADDSGGLIKWAAEQAAAYAVDNLDTVASMVAAGDERDRIITYVADARQQTLNRAARRGTEVHELAEQITLGEEVEVPDELVGPVDAYLRFLREWTPTPILVERAVFDLTYGYGGTFDLIADLPGLGRTLIDLKTSGSRPYHTTVLQLAAYAGAEFYLDDDGSEQPMPDVDGLAVLWLRPDSYELIPFRHDPGDLDIFRHALTISRWRDKGTRKHPAGPMYTAAGDALDPPHPA